MDMRLTVTRCCACPKVTKKKVAGEEEPDSHWDEFKRALAVTWPHLLYYVALAAGTVFFIVRAALGSFK